MKPENFSRVGSTKPALDGRPDGGGASSRNASRKGRTPKLVIAEPKNIGESCPSSTFCRENSSPPMSRSSMSSASFSSSCSDSTPRISCESSGTMRSATSLSPWVPSEAKTCTLRERRS